MTNPQTRFQFIESLYYSGYMSLLSGEQDKRVAEFSFIPREPPVSPVSAKYFTPRGSHITISQAGLYLIENILVEEGLDITPEQYRTLTREGRMKIVELNQKFRKTLGLKEPLEARLMLKNIRWGKMPMVKVDFDLGDRGFYGNFTAVLEPIPVPQMNEDIMARN